MRQLLLISLFSLSVFCIAQSHCYRVVNKDGCSYSTYCTFEISEITFNIDTITIPIHDCINFNENTNRLFYVYNDTLNEKDSVYRIGKRTIDTNEVFNNLYVGIWKSYYSNGNLLSSGKYEIGITTECSSYNEKTCAHSYYSDKWTFYYANGKKMAIGFFDNKFQIKKWKFYNDKGKTINEPTKFIEEIINGG